MERSPKLPHLAVQDDAANLARLARQLEQRVVRCYVGWAETLRHRGLEELASLLDRYAAEARDLGAACAMRLQHAVEGAQPTPASAGSTGIDGNLFDDDGVRDLDAQIASPYQILAAAVRLEDSAFRALSHCCAETRDPAVRDLAESMAHLQLTRAARLRRHRRAAYRGGMLSADAAPLPDPRLVESTTDLIFAAMRIEASLQKSLAVALDQQPGLGPCLMQTQETLDRLQRKAGASGTPSAALVEAFETLAAARRGAGAMAETPLMKALTDSKHGFSFYDEVVGGVTEEATMLLAQDLSDGALRRLRALIEATHAGGNGTTHPKTG